MSKKNRERKAAGKAGTSAGTATTKRLYTILGVVGVLVVGFVGYSIVSGGGQGATQPIEVAGMDDPGQLVALAQGMEMGDEDATVTIVEFGDYQCPGCAYFATTVEPQIEAELVETGKARFIFYDFPLVGSGHPHSFLAARGVHCAMDQDRGWEYHKALYSNQTRWSLLGDPTNQFVSYASELGLDQGMFNSCLRSDQHADVVSANLRLGQELGVNGTPTILVGEGGGAPAKRIGMASDPWIEISAEVERILAAQGSTAATSDGAAVEEEGSGG